MKRYWLVLLVMCMAIGSVNAEQKDPNAISIEKWNIAVKDPANPDELMQAKWNSVVNVLKDKALDANTKTAVIDIIIRPVFDFELMGKLSVGKTNWPKFSEAQRVKFLSLFVDKLKTSYRDKIMMYENQTAQFQPAVPNKDTVQITMNLISNDSKTVLLYKLRKADKSWKIYDVEIEGVSILLTYRSQFNDILSRGTVDELISQLEKPASTPPARCEP
jgi:phospholipid transport system substrate-binding protein